MDAASGSKAMVIGELSIPAYQNNKKQSVTVCMNRLDSAQEVTISWPGITLINLKVKY